MSPLFPQSAPNLTSGAAIFVEKCAPCHGDKGLGDGPMASQLQKVPVAIGSVKSGRLAAPANWYTTVTQGNINSFMPPFNASLSDQQRWDVVAYSISLGGSTPAEAASGKPVYEKNCINCHGPAGDLVENAKFTDQALMAKLAQTDIANFANKGVGKMPGFGGLIPDADLYAAAAYVRTFSVISADVAVSASATPESSAPVSTPAAVGTPDGSQASSVDSTLTPEAAASAPVAVTGSVSGKIENGSGGAIPTGLKAVLHVFEHDTASQQFNEVDKYEADVSADGAYKFDTVAISENRAYYVTVNHSGTDYESDPVFPEAGQTALEVGLKIYDTTTDASGLLADQVHILLDYSKGDVVQVVEFLIITNPGTKTIVPSEKGGPVFKVSLPKGYTNLQFEQGALGERFVKTDDGFADTTSVVPGTKNYQIVFAIDLPMPKPGLFGGKKLAFTQPFPFKANGLSVIAPKGVTVEGSNFTPGKLQDMGTGTQFQVFDGGTIEAGKSLEVSASGEPAGTTAATTSAANPNQNIIIGIGAFGLVLIIAGIWLYLRDRKHVEDDLENDEDEDEDEEETDLDEIMDAIVTLDDQYKAGNIQETAYKQRRAELKAKLKNRI